MNDLSFNEFAIEWVRGDEIATVTACSYSKLKSKLLKYAESHPEECKILHINSDGSICAHVPVKWVKVSPPRTMSEEQRAAAGERLNKARRR